MTKAGVAKDIEKVNKSSEVPPLTWPIAKRAPAFEKNLSLGPSLAKTILLSFGTNKIIIPTGIKIGLDQTKTVKKFS